MRTNNQTRDLKWRKLVIGDALSLNRLSTEELRLLLSYPYSFYILPEVLYEVRVPIQELLMWHRSKAKLILCTLSASEKIKANMQPKQGNWQTDNYSLFLARRMKAPMLVGDEYWRLQAKTMPDVTFIHTDRNDMLNFLLKLNAGSMKRTNVQVIEFESKKIV